MTAALLVEGNEKLAEAQSAALVSSAYQVLCVRDGLEALRAFYENVVDLVIIGTPVQKFDSIELTRLLRNLTDVPILLVVPAAASPTVVRLLEAGADDVVTANVAPEEFLARIRACFRRLRRADHPPLGEESIVKTGSLVIDRKTRVVTRAGQPVALSQTEYRLLDALASQVGRVAPHRFLLSTVWGDAFVEDTHYLRMYIGYLRAKLEDDPAQPVYLKNEWGTGYRLSLLPDPAGTETLESTGGTPVGGTRRVFVDASVTGNSGSDPEYARA